MSISEFHKTIYSQSYTICSFVETFLTTYSTESSDFGNYEIHSIEWFLFLLILSPLKLIHQEKLLLFDTFSFLFQLERVYR